MNYPDQQEALPFGDIQIEHAAYVLLWEKKGKKLTPKKTFQPSFPGEGFSHEVNLAQAMSVAIACPCERAEIMIHRESGASSATLSVCPVCASWHTVTWPARAGLGDFIFC